MRSLQKGQPGRNGLKEWDVVQGLQPRERREFSGEEAL